ncbi:MAG: site-specific integrase, partial [Trichlorobacter sp.]|uniref:tyrosine-type recombinase/integrase n=1 Tax=Trichlorobacter sp. TaxID=2911007 RepID=UPI0025680397
IIERGSPGMANNTFKIIRKMLNYAVEKDILPYSCATGVKLPAPLNSRERVLSQEEIKLFWNNLEKASMTEDIKLALKLIILTAQRPGEVIGMHTNDIDKDWWTIPADRQEQDGKGRAKNKKSHRVYLTETVQHIIAEQVERVMSARNLPHGSDYKGYIFPSRHQNKNQSVDRHAVSRAVARNIAFPLTDTKGRPLYQKDGQPATVNKLEVDDFTPHDLRRTAATFMAQAGEMDEVIDAVLNHAKQGVIRVYNQYRYDTEKQKALETWEQKILSIINGAENNVISIKRNRA